MPALLSPVTIVVLTWNGLSYTKACLASIRETTDVREVEVVVVDNGSTDGTVEYLREIGWVRAIFNDRNLGFVGGNNVALRAIDRSRDVILLNNDTTIDDDRWVRKLQTTAYSDPSVGLVGCRIRQMNSNVLQHAGTYMPDTTYWGQQIAAGEVDVNQYSRDREVEGVVFACVYIRREVLETVGFLNEAYFSYFEDTDYCFAAKQRGYRVMLCGDLTISHREHGSTAANGANFSRMFLESQRTFVTKWKEVLARRYDVSVTWHSTFTRPIGYAMASRAIATGLEDAGIEVSYRYLYGPGTVFPIKESESESTGDYRLNVIRQRKPSASVPNVIFGQADAFEAVRGTYRIGWTMLETTGIPPEWVRQCNVMDEVWVPSPFNEWTFRRSGVTVPIRVVPLGLIDDGRFNPDITGRRIEGVYTFLSIFEWGERKAVATLLKAFNRAFRRSDPVVLICKFVNSDPGVNPRQEIAALGLDPEGGLVLLSENEQLPYYQMAVLYRSADCFVLPTRGEGWGMPILEAMACGLPVIASYWSAQQSFMTDANSYPLQVALVDAEAKCPYYTGFKWAEPDEDHLVQLLRRAYERQEEARAKGRQAARDVERLWTMRASARRVRERIEALGTPGSAGILSARCDVTAPRIAVDVSRAIGHEVTGVGRYVVNLLQGLKHLSPEENPFDYLLLPGFASFVHPEYLRDVDVVADLDERFTVYRGPLPAFSSEDTHVPGVAVVHCTANAMPRTIEGPSVFVAYDLTFLTHPQHHTEENIRLCREGFERAALSNCVFAAISESTKADLVKHYDVAPQRVFVAYPGVDPSAFYRRSERDCERARERYGLPQRFFLFVGSLEPRKNLKTVVQSLLNADIAETLVVVGASGWMNAGLHDVIARAGSRVKLLGYVPQEDLPVLYSAALATVYPSLYEGFGFPVVESMACGTPVITSDNSSLSEIGRDAALLLREPEEPLELQVALERMSGDAELWQKLADAGLERAGHFVPEVGARATLDIYKRFIG